MPRDILVPLESLAKGRPPETNLTRADLDAIAHLALLIQTRMMPTQSYNSLGEKERAALRAVVLSVVQSLVLLGWIELPS